VLLLKHLLASIIASSLLGYNTTSVAHLYFGSFSHSSPQIPSSSVRLDGERRFLQIGFKSGLWLGHSRTLRLVPKSLLRCLGYVLKVVVLLEGEPLPQSEVLSALDQVFIKDLCSLLRSSLPRS
jgi:hypothetical protein